MLYWRQQFEVSVRTPTKDDQVQKRPNLTVAELKELILANMRVRGSEKVKFEERLRSELGAEPVEKSSFNDKIFARVFEWLSDLTAKRLKNRRRTNIVLSERDVARIALTIIDEIQETSGGVIPAGERRMLVKFVKASLNGVIEEFEKRMVLPGRNYYDEYWRWITIVVELAREHGVSPVEYISLPGASNEITRRSFTRKQYASLLKRSFAPMISIRFYRKTLLQPLLDIAPNKEDRLELKKEFETEQLPLLAQHIERMKPILATWAKEEIVRIYDAV